MQNIYFSEWHPFTISSAPEQPGTFTLHVRGVGQWTNRLYSYFEEVHRTQIVGMEKKRVSIIPRIMSNTTSALKKNLSLESQHREYSATDFHILTSMIESEMGR